VKKCTKCDETKPFDEFRKSARYKDGYYSRCKKCMQEYEAKNLDQEKKRESRTRYRENNREHIREQDREAYHKDPDKFREKAKISQKKYFQTEKGREKYKQQALKLREKYPEKARARSLLSNAVCDGKIIRPSKCSLCGWDQGKIEAHHPDYSKPLEVIWVCKSCHFLVHDRIKFHRDRLSGKTPNGDATVKASEETARGTSEE
jgi:Bacillus phage endonuclease